MILEGAAVAAAGVRGVKRALEERGKGGSKTRAVTEGVAGAIGLSPTATEGLHRTVADATPAAKAAAAGVRRGAKVVAEKAPGVAGKIKGAAQGAAQAAGTAGHRALHGRQFGRKGK